MAQRCEEELGEEAGGAIESGPRDRGQRPGAEGPITVGIDGGYVRDWEQTQRHFEVIVGKSVPTVGPPKCFGFVQTYDTNPTQRLGRHCQLNGSQPDMTTTYGGHDFLNTLYGIISHLVSLKLTMPDIQYIPILIDCPPEILPLALDRQTHFIHMPLVARPGTAATE